MVYMHENGMNSATFAQPDRYFLTVYAIVLDLDYHLVLVAYKKLRVAMCRDQVRNRCVSSIKDRLFLCPSKTR